MVKAEEVSRPTWRSHVFTVVSMGRRLIVLFVAALPEKMSCLYIIRMVSRVQLLSFCQHQL